MVQATQTPVAATLQATDESTAIVPAFAPDAVRGSWPISLDALQANLSHNTQDAIDTFVACFRWCINPDHMIRLEEFAKRVNADPTTISRILKGKYLHPETGVRMPISTALLKSMQEFLRLEGERASAKRIGFVMTPTAKRIWNACDLARESQSPVFLIGPSHIGKTWALREYADKNNHGRTVYARLKAANGLGGMIRVIAAAAGVGANGNTADLIERIKRGLKPNMILILDEVHQLMYTYRKESFFACLEVLREIYDEAGCGFVFCGTKLLLKRVEDNRGELEQFFRRGVHKIILPDQPLRADVAAIVVTVGLEMPERADVVRVTVGGQHIAEQPYEMLRQIGRDEGLKAITERIRYGQKVATKARERFSWEHVVRAHFIIRQAAQPQNDWE